MCKKTPHQNDTKSTPRTRVLYVYWFAGYTHRVTRDADLNEGISTSLFDDSNMSAVIAVTVNRCKGAACDVKGSVQISQRRHLKWSVFSYNDDIIASVVFFKIEKKMFPPHPKSCHTGFTHHECCHNRTP